LSEKYKDVIAGLFLNLMGIIMLVATSDIPIMDEMSKDVGSSFMPKIGAALLCIFGLIILISGVRKYFPGKVGKESVSKESGGVAKEGKLQAAAVTLALMVAYILLINPIGFLIATTLYLFAQIIILAPREKRNYPLFGIIAVVVSASIYFTFLNVFSMMLPMGILG